MLIVLFASRWKESRQRGQKCLEVLCAVRLLMVYIDWTQNPNEVGSKCAAMHIESETGKEGLQAGHCNYRTCISQASSRWNGIFTSKAHLLPTVSEMHKTSMKSQTPGHIKTYVRIHIWFAIEDSSIKNVMYVLYTSPDLESYRERRQMKMQLEHKNEKRKEQNMAHGTAVNTRACSRLTVFQS